MATDAIPQAWWLNSGSSCIVSTAHSPWLASALADLDAKTLQMLKIVNQDADSFARRAEMYYLGRPALLALISDMYRSHRLLAEQHDQLKSCRRGLIWPPGESAKGVMIKQDETSDSSLSSVVSSEHSFEDDGGSEVDDPDVDAGHEPAVPGTLDKLREKNSELERLKEWNAAFLVEQVDKKCSDDHMAQGAVELNSQVLEQLRQENVVMRKEMVAMRKESAKETMIKQDELSYSSSVHSFDNDDDSEIDDPDVDAGREPAVMGTLDKLMEKKAELGAELERLKEGNEAFLAGHVDDKSSGHDMARWAAELNSQLEQLKQENAAMRKEMATKDEEKREAIRQLSSSISFLQSENIGLRQHVKQLLKKAKESSCSGGGRGGFRKLMKDLFSGNSCAMKPKNPIAVPLPRC